MISFISTGGCHGDTPQHQVQDVHLSVCPSKSISSGLHDSRLESVEESVPVSSSQASFEGFMENGDISRLRSDYLSNISSGNVVDSLDENHQRSPSPESASSAVGPGDKSRGLSRLVKKLNRLQFLRIAYQKFLSVEVTSSLIAAFRNSSNKQWQYAWKKFQTFLTQKRTSFVTKAVVLEFLNHEFTSRKLSPKTIQVYKNALTVPLKVAFDIDTGDKEFQLLVRSFFIARPPVKRILPRWSLNTVLTHIQDSTDDSDEFLLQKSLFLMALATGNRASEIAATVRTAVKFEANPVKVFIPVKPKFLFKNQRSGRAPPNISFPALKPDGSNHKLCPVQTLRSYMDRSKEWNRSQALFCSQNGSPLKSSDVSIRMCRLIEQACPGSIPKGHDVRKIGTSLAWCRGIEPKEIVERTFWASSNVFICRYLSEVEDRVECVALGTVR